MPEKRYKGAAFPDTDSSISQTEYRAGILAIDRCHKAHPKNTKGCLKHQTIILFYDGSMDKTYHWEEEFANYKKPKKKKPKQTPSDEKIVAAASGSGFFVSNNGDIITNHHVIEGCDAVKVSFTGDEIKAKTLAIDKMNDIAILQANIKPDQVYSVSNEDVSMLEEVYVAGYPLGKKVSSAIKNS